MARTLKVLIEASGCLTSTYMIDSIKSAGHLVCGSDIDSFNASYAYCDDFILMPRADSPTLWEEVSALLLAHKIDVVIPTLDESLLGWSERKEYFASLGIAILLSPPHTIETFIDKWRTYRFFRKIGIPTPNTALYHHYGILKPRYGRGGSGIQKETEESMNRFYKAFSRGGGENALSPTQASIETNIQTGLQVSNAPKRQMFSQEGCLYLTQEEIYGEEYTIDCLFDSAGKEIYIIPRRRVGVRDGKSTKGEVCYVESIITHIRIIAAHIALQGAINVQAFLTSSGEAVFIEVNPRLGGGSALAFAASENWIEAMIEHFVYGKPIAPKPIKWGLKMARSYTEVYF